MPTVEGGESLPFPYHGYLISQQFAPAGGIEKIRAMCAGCPVNMSPDRIARCSGVLSPWSWYPPSTDGSDRDFSQLLAGLGIEIEFAATFLPTTPRWYGLWAQSPLSPEACRLLALIYAERHDARVEDFIRAARLAATGTATLHVSVCPPGATCANTFLGHTPYCPRCKADAELPFDTNRRYPTNLHACRVCGQTFSPAETITQPLHFDDPPTVRELLSPAEFERFLVDYYTLNGLSPKGVPLALAQIAADDRKQANETEIAIRRHEQTQAWIQKELYGGLIQHRKKVRGTLSPKEDIVVFTEADFAVIIARAEAKGVEIWLIEHYSVKSDRDITYGTHESSVAEVMSRFAHEGCHDFFHASFNVPDRLLDLAP